MSTYNFMCFTCGSICSNSPMRYTFEDATRDTRYFDCLYCLTTHLEKLDKETIKKDLADINQTNILYFEVYNPIDKNFKYTMKYAGLSGVFIISMKIPLNMITNNSMSHKMEYKDLMKCSFEEPIIDKIMDSK